MEDRVWEILASKDDWDHNKMATAQEIAGHYHNFFDWYDAISGKGVDHTLQAYNRFLQIESDDK